MKAIIKNATVTEENAHLVSFAQTIDFTQLFDHIKTFAGISCTFQPPEIATYRDGGVYIEILSDDIASQAGVFGKILKRCHIQSGSGGVCSDRENDGVKYWVIISLAYSHKDGGSNGMELCHAWYTDSEGWVFKDVGSDSGEEG